MMAERVDISFGGASEPWNDQWLGGDWDEVDIAMGAALDFWMCSSYSWDDSAMLDHTLILETGKAHYWDLVMRWGGLIELGEGKWRDRAGGLGMMDRRRFLKTLGWLGGAVILPLPMLWKRPEGLPWSDPRSRPIEDVRDVRAAYEGMVDPALTAITVSYWKLTVDWERVEEDHLCPSRMSGDNRLQIREALGSCSCIRRRGETQGIQGPRDRVIF